MLWIRERKSAAAVKKYFREHLEPSDYYLGGEQEPGQWLGKGSRMLGLEGEVDKGSFEALCDNTHPGTGNRLTARTNANRRVCYELILDAPKSVSMAHGLFNDPAVREAFDQSCAETLKEIESEVQARIRKGGKSNEDRTTANIVAASFCHHTTRPLEDGTPDPHLHQHSLIFNCTYDNSPEEQRWKALQFARVVKDKGYWESRFHSRLAKQLQKVGYAIRATEKAFEIAGIPQSAIDKFCRRTQEVNQYNEEHNITGAKAKEMAGLLTRRAKGEELPKAQLQAAWNSRLTSEEHKALEQVRQKQVKPSRTPIKAKQAFEYAKEHCFERTSVIDQRKLEEEALRIGVGSVTPADLKAHHDPGLLIKRESDRVLCTTKKVLQEETQLLQYCREGQGACEPIALDYQPDANTPMTDEQATVSLSVLHSTDRYIGVKGGAGTGKTFAFEHIRETVQQQGKSFIALVPGSQMAYEELPKKGFASATVARFLHDPDLREKAKGQVVWIDEAGQMGMKDMHQLFRYAKELDFRLCVSGDTRQHNSVPRGDSLRLLQQSGLLVPTEINQIRRQQGHYRNAVELLAKGHLQSGYGMLEQMGVVHEKEGDERVKAMAKDYVETVQSGKSVLAVAPTNKERQKITEAIRKELLQQNRLGKTAMHCDTLTATNFTLAQKREALYYRSGMVLYYTRHEKGIPKGSFVEISQVKDGQVYARNPKGKEVPINLANADRYTVFSRERIELRQNDLIRMTHNTKSREGSRLYNGTVYSVEGFDESGNIRLSNGKTLKRDNGFYIHGYCTTSYSSQGKTVDKVIIGQGSESFGATFREQFYVSVSRGRKSISIYTEDRDQLREAIERSSERVTTSEIADWQAQKSKWQAYTQYYSRTLQNVLSRAHLKQQEFKNRAKDRLAQLSHWQHKQIPIHPRDPGYEPTR